MNRQATPVQAVAVGVGAEHLAADPEAAGAAGRAAEEAAPLGATALGKNTA